MTTQLAESQDMFRAAFEQVQRDGAPAHPLRTAAFARFSEVGLPTTRLEAWRFTNVSPISQQRFVVSASGDFDPEAVAAFELHGVDGLQVVSINGRFEPLLSNFDTAPDGIAVRSLAAEFGEGRTASTAAFGQLATFDDPAAAFTALNTALFCDGIVVHVPANTIVDAPVHLLFAATGREGLMSHPRVLVVVGENSQLRLVESYAGLGDGVYLTNAVTEIVLGDNAVVDHYKLLRESVEAYHVASMHVRLSRSANFSSHAITLGGAIVRNDVFGALEGEGAECTLNGLYLVNDARLVDNHTTIYHATPHCNSHELYKGILDDRGRAVFNGKIIVGVDAQKTDAKQTNKALLLSEDAQINTKPELEIFADDVKCTHGATVGQLDADALFYLRSRGLDAEQARDVLIHAFANDLLNQISIEPIRAELDAVLLKQLPGSRHTTFAVA